MSDKVTELNSKAIFAIEGEYCIPLYQRAFAWEEKQLVQLIEDIEDIGEDAHYYLGSLIVSRRENVFEVVDGQQRLTSLYLLLSCLGIKLKHTLSFACRDKSNYTLINIRELLEGNRSKFDLDHIEAGLYQGMKILKEKIDQENFDREEFLKKLERVILYRIEVPEHTDLNRYFEIMNTRGEQLEQHDILKASLMRHLLEEDERTAFARVWEACSDMTGYLQMHFNVKERELLFGNAWRDLPPEQWNEVRQLAEFNGEEGDGFSIADIVKKNFSVASAEDADNEESLRVRFESIIDFPYFLLHVLHVFIRVYSVKHADKEKELLPELLDDKKLIDSFNRVIQNGVMRGRRLSSFANKRIFAKRFILCLLRSRFLFDKYIIKREYANDNADGEWSLKELRVSGQQTNKRPYYTNTRFTRSGEWASTNDKRNRMNMMLQSALRVSYTSPKVMHWITALLYWLSANHCANIHEEALAEYDVQIESIAVKAVTENFFAVCPDGDYALGTNTPHIVFNYLDFLLWKANDKKYRDFTFEFRNSVEHWYPQNPSEGTFEPWIDGADCFGNLCIIQRRINAKFSNLSPEAKKSTFYQMIAKGSLKLRIMSELTEKRGSQPANVCWKEAVCREHEAEMIGILKSACKQ